MLGFHFRHRIRCHIEPSPEQNCSFHRLTRHLVDEPDRNFSAITVFDVKATGWNSKSLAPASAAVALKATKQATAAGVAAREKILVMRQSPDVMNLASAKRQTQSQPRHEPWSNQFLGTVSSDDGRSQKGWNESITQWDCRD